MAKEFRDGLSSLLTEVEHRVRAEHPTIRFETLHYAAGSRDASEMVLGLSYAFAIIDVTDYDDDIAFVAGLMEGARIPYAFVRQRMSGAGHRPSLDQARAILYDSMAELFQPDFALHREISQAVTGGRVLEELIYQVWFPRDTTTIWVVCPQIHDPGEFAARSSPDYTYLDNLGDTDALLDVMVFLSRYYPKATVEKFSSEDLPRDHAKNNLVVIGGPGSSGEISNELCLEMMQSIRSRISYNADCDKMLVARGADSPLELRAQLRSDVPDDANPDQFNLQRDYGYFARFPNPLNAASAVVLVNGIHTGGVIASARAFGDRPEALRNFHSVFRSDANPKSFECQFEVGALRGDVRVPNISLENIYTLGPMVSGASESREHCPPLRQGVDQNAKVALTFVAGDRGGLQRYQLQIPREFRAIEQAIQASKHRDSFRLTTPILAATHQNFIEAYRHEPAILHFAGHGDDRSLSFISDQGALVSQTPIMADQLAAIIKIFPVRVRLCIFNTCDSEFVAKRLVDSEVVDAAVGWSGQLDDAAGIAFARALYGGLGDGLSLEQSVSLAAQACPAVAPPKLFQRDRHELHLIDNVGKVIQ